MKNIPTRRVVLLAACAATLGAVVWAYMTDPAEETLVEAAERGAIAPGASAAAGGSSSAVLSLENLPRLTLPERQHDLFSKKSWAPPPPPPPPTPQRAAAPSPPPKPTAPPLPFAYMGVLEEEQTKPIYFLSAGEKVYAVSAGETLDATYRIDGMRGGQLMITYLPLNMQQSLSLSAAAAAAFPPALEAPLAAPRAAADDADDDDADPPAPEAAAGEVMLAWSGPASAKVGEEIAVTLSASSSKPLNTSLLTLNYDPKALAVLRINEGSLLKRGGARTAFRPRIDADTGRISVRLERLGQSGVAGDGDLFSIVLKGNAPANDAKLGVLTTVSAGIGNQPLVTAALAPYQFQIRP